MDEKSYKKQCLILGCSFVTSGILAKAGDLQDEAQSSHFARSRWGYH